MPPTARWTSTSTATGRPPACRSPKALASCSPRSATNGASIPATPSAPRRALRAGGSEHERPGSITRGGTMQSLTLTKLGALSAILLVAGFVVGIALMASGGVQVLIPETGKDGLDWISDVQDAGNLFTAGAAIVVFAGLFGLVAFVGFYDALRAAGPIMVIAPIAGVAGVVLVTISHATPIAMANELAPGYTHATGAARASLLVTHETLASFCLLMNYFGDILVWG